MKYDNLLDIVEGQIENKMNIVYNVKFSMENNMVPMLITNVHEYVKKNQCADVLGWVRTRF